MGVLATPLSSSATLWVKVVFEEGEKAARYQGDNERFLLRAERADGESRLGGGGKVGTMVLTFGVIGSITRVEDRYRCSKRHKSALRRVSSVYREGSAVTAVVWIVSVRDARASVSNGVEASVSGAEMTIVSGFEALGAMSMGKLVEALSRSVGWIRKNFPESLSQSRLAASFC